MDVFVCCFRTYDIGIDNFNITFFLRLSVNKPLTRLATPLFSGKLLRLADLGSAHPYFFPAARVSNIIVVQYLGISQ